MHMEALWKGTKQTPVTSILVQEEKRIRARSEELKDTDPITSGILAKTAEKVQEAIQKRTADKRFWVECKHIGNPADPLRWNEMRTQYEAATHAVEVRVRRSLLEQHKTPQAVAEAEGVGTFAEAVNAAVSRDPERLRVVLDHARAVVEAGTVGGAETVERMLAVGKVGLLIHALEEVRAFQEVDTEMGEG